jgi:predicted Zn-dependent protease
MHRSLFKLVFIMPLLPLLLAACATNPVTGKKELSFLSLDDEEQLGAQSDQGIVAQYGVVEDPQLASYVQSIGDRMVPISHMPDEDFVFRLLDDPVVNAFALPGGYVYITRGILAYMNAEAALAGVMGHEIGHVTARHGAQRYTQQLLVGMGTGVAATVFGNVPAVADVLGASGSLLLLKYSRDDERQSDELGVEYATKIGYDTRPMADFFQTLEMLSGDQRLPGWASTHPDPGDRHDTVLELTSQWQAQVGSAEYSTNRNGYIEKLEGLIFGNNPRQGFEHGGDFVHPELAFRFPIPDQWQWVNTAAAVQMGAPDKKAMITFQLASGQASPNDAATAFLQQNDFTEQLRRSLQISGYSAVEVVGSITSQGQTLVTQATFIAKDNLIYFFTGLSLVDDFNRYRPTFTQVAAGFGPLQDSALLNIQPVAVHVIVAERTARFRDLVRNHPIPEQAGIELAGLALMNGFGPDETVPQGTFLKVLQLRNP